jgi:hypothetical protein
LHDAASDATEAPLLALALLVETEARSAQAAARNHRRSPRRGRCQRVDDLHIASKALPPGLRQPLIDVAMPALRKLPPGERARLLKIAYLLIAADGRITVREFLLYTILKRRLGPAAGQAVAARFKSAAELPSETSLTLSLVALLRLPERPEHAFNAGALAAAGRGSENDRSAAHTSRRGFSSARSLERTDAAGQAAIDQGADRGRLCRTV